MKDQQTELALHYFDYLAKRFPVMSASDEFYFLPRSEAASQYYDLVDNLDADAIDECVFALKDFQKKFDALAIHEHDLEKLADLELLRANIAGILIELETKRSWCHNPLLYLKIAFIGLDHALTKPASEPQEQIERAVARLQGITKLLQQAIDNVDSVAKTYHQAALAMLSDCKTYLDEIGERFAETNGGHLIEGLEKARSSLDAFGKFLCAVSPTPEQLVVVPAFKATLKDHFLYSRNLTEVFQLAGEEWQENLAQLKKLQKTVDPNKSWKELYHDYCPSDIENLDTISLYQHEIERLRSFFRKCGFSEVTWGSSLVLCETPTYLRSVRGSASFSTAFSKDVREKDFFYMTTRQPHNGGKEAKDFVMKRLHREYKFLAAHETVPGHHLLDSVRRRLENPVRRQIESPLFYEGWAYYAETLLAEYGYVESPMDRLVDCKRRLWRAARCQIDVGLNTGIVTKERAIDLLTGAGFSSGEAHRQVERFGLNPGYQVCYSSGRHEIMKLRETYAVGMGRDQFHKQLLEGGELPFHLIEKRFELRKKS
jgi:uncharacterized protein (DUF885 family)